MNWNLIIRTYRLIYSCDRKGFLWLLFLSAASALLPLANLTVLKRLVDIGLEGNDFRQLMLYVVIFSAIFFLSRLISTCYGASQDILGQKFADYTNSLVHAQSAKMDLAYYDNVENHNKLYRAQQEASLRPLQLLNNSIRFFTSAVSIIGIVALLAGSSPWAVAVLVVTVIPAFFVRLRKSRSLYDFRRERTVVQRRSAYLSSLVTNRNYALEVKARGLSGYFCRKYVEIRQELRGMINRIIRKMTAYDILCAVFEAVSVLAVTVILLKGTVSGAYTVGSFVMLFEAFRRGQSNFNDLTFSLAGIYDNLLFLSNLFDFMDIKPEVLSPEHPLPFPDEVSDVQFDDVCFSYPGSDTPVLNHFSLTARKGEITRIEGPNGFGKTTMVKLLLRLYDPQEGRVLVNGTDIRKFALEDLRHRVSAAFQELNIFNFSIRENIELGDLGEGEADEERLSEALRLSESSAIIDGYPDGLDTMVGREYDNGVVPSMGQKQRLCLARHLYSNADIMIFDEPTAWMDAVSRAAFLEHLQELSANRVVIFISHIQ